MSYFTFFKKSNSFLPILDKQKRFYRPALLTLILIAIPFLTKILPVHIPFPMPIWDVSYTGFNAEAEGVSLKFDEPIFYFYSTLIIGAVIIFIIIIYFLMILMGYLIAHPLYFFAYKKYGSDNALELKNLLRSIYFSIIPLMMLLIERFNQDSVVNKIFTGSLFSNLFVNITFIWLIYFLRYGFNARSDREQKAEAEAIQAENASQGMQAANNEIKKVRRGKSVKLLVIAIVENAIEFFSQLPRAFMVIYDFLLKLASRGSNFYLKHRTHDLKEIELQFKKFEEKIARLEQLKKELDSLNTEAFQAETQELDEYLKKPDKIKVCEMLIHELKDKIKKREAWLDTIDGLFDTAESASNRGSELYEKKQYKKAVQQYEKASNSFKEIEKRAPIVGRTELIEPISKRIAVVEKNLIITQVALAASITEDGNNNLLSNEFDKAIEKYNEALDCFNLALTRSKTSGGGDLVDEIKSKTEIVKKNMAQAEIGVDKITVENLVAEATKNLEKVESLAEKGVLFKAKELLLHTSDIFDRAFFIAKNRDFKKSLNVLKKINDNTRAKISQVDEAIIKEKETLKFVDKVSSINIESEPDLPFKFEDIKDVQTEHDIQDPFKTKAKKPKKKQHRFEIIQLIGEGGFGKVYKAFDNIDKETVALKVLHKSVWQDEDVLANIRKEMKITRDLTHDNIVQAYGLFEVLDNEYAISMKYIDGGSLKELIKQNKFLELKSGIRIALDVLSGLEYAHKKGVIHGDIKPDNILLVSKGTALISDFGISRIIRTSDAFQSWSMSIMKNQSSGYSPVYSAPEQLDYDRGSIDTTTDIYALGCTFYEMITGRPPFLGESLPMLHLEKKPTPLRQFRAEIPGELEKIVLKCLEKKQKDRYQSAGEIISELKKVTREQR